MRPEELVEAIRAALDELELLAKDCIDEVGDHVAGGPLEDGSGVADLDAFPSYPYGSQERELAYMKAVQPREMLRRVEADRRVLDRHSRSDFGRWCGTCHWCSDTCGAALQRWPCPDLLDLADRYGIEVEENA